MVFLIYRFNIKGFERHGSISAIFSVFYFLGALFRRGNSHGGASLKKGVRQKISLERSARTTTNGGAGSMNIMKRFIYFGFLISFIGGQCLAADKGNLRVAGEGDKAQGQALGCDERIFAYSSLLGDFTFPLDVRFLWVRPDGEIQEQALVPIRDALKPGAEVYSWLKIDGDEGVLGDFALGGDYGDRRQVFNGVWQVVVTAGGKEMARQSFNVLCMR